MRNFGALVGGIFETFVVREVGPRDCQLVLYVADLSVGQWYSEEVVDGPEHVTKSDIGLLLNDDVGPKDAKSERFFRTGRYDDLHMLHLGMCCEVLELRFETGYDTRP